MDVMNILKVKLLLSTMKKVFIRSAGVLPAIKAAMSMILSAMESNPWMQKKVNGLKIFRKLMIGERKMGMIDIYIIH